MSLFECPACQSVSEAGEPGVYACPACEAAFEVHADDLRVAAAAVAARDDGAPGTAWESGGGPVGLLAAFFSVLLGPRRFFERFALAGGVARMVVYVALVGLLAGAAQAGLFYLTETTFAGTPLAQLSNPQIAQLAPDLARQLERIDLQELLVGGAVLALVGAPLGALMQAAVWAALLHLCVNMLGGVRRSFGATFRAACYVEGGFFSGITVLMPGLPIPVFVALRAATGNEQVAGMFVGLAQLLATGLVLGWGIYASAAALDRVHGTGIGRGVGAALLAAVIMAALFVALFSCMCCLLFGMIVSLLGGR